MAYCLCMEAKRTARLLSYRSLKSSGTTIRENIVNCFQDISQPCKIYKLTLSYKSKVLHLEP